MSKHPIGYEYDTLFGNYPVRIKIDSELIKDEDGLEWYRVLYKYMPDGKYGKHCVDGKQYRVMAVHPDIWKDYGRRVGSLN